MERIIWSQSPDGFVISSRDFEVNQSENYVSLRVRIPFIHTDHFEHFAELIEQENAKFDLRSRVAQNGYDFDQTSPLIISPSNRSVILEGRLYPWKYDQLPKDGNWWDLVDPNNFFVGKLVDLSRDLRAKKDELEDLIRKGLVRLPQGSRIEEDRVFLAFDGTILVPDENLMTLQHLRAALYELSRERLNELRIPIRVDQVVVPATGGVLAHTGVRPYNLSFAINLEQKDGVKHTKAFYVEPNSQHSQIIELKGNKKNGVPIDGIYGNFFRAEERYVASRVVIPSYKLSPADVKAKQFSRSYWVFVPRDSGVRKLLKVSPYDPASLRKFDNVVRHGPKGAAYYFYTFPSAEVLAKIESYAAERRIGTLIFSVPPLEEDRFTTEQYNTIKKLTKWGVNVIWDSQQFGRLQFHRFAFMKREMRAVFDKAYSSGSIMAVFGSHFPLENHDITELTKVIEGFKEFVGGDEGYGTIVSGGGPGSMTQSLNIAKAFNLYTGAIHLIRRGQVSATDEKIGYGSEQIPAYSKVDVDFLFPFDIKEINIRQDTLVGLAKVYVVTEGGVGTFYEVYETLVKKGFYFSGEPVIMIGDSKFFKPTLEQIAEMGARNRISPHIKSHIYHIEDGNEFLPLVLRHYKFQKNINSA